MILSRFSPSGGRAGRASWATILALTVSSLVSLPGCDGSGSDRHPAAEPAQEAFYMAVNGERVTPKLKPGAAFVERSEDDWNVYRRFGIRFPAGRNMGRLEPGVEIDFDPEQIESGDLILFDGEIGNIIRVSYRPDHGHVMSEARILTYYALESDTGSVRFEEFDPSPGGRIAGTLIGAVLHARFDDVDDGEFIEPVQPMELYLRNFEFDCRMPDYN